MNPTIHAAPSQPAFDVDHAAEFVRNADVPASATVNDDGSVDHNVDLSRYEGKDKEAAEELIEAFAKRIEALEA